MFKEQLRNRKRGIIDFILVETYENGNKTSVDVKENLYEHYRIQHLLGITVIYDENGSKFQQKKDSNFLIINEKTVRVLKRNAFFIKF